MKFERTRVCGFENALYGMRNAKNSWSKIDSDFGFCGEEGLEDEMVILHKNNDIYEYVKIGKNDMKLAQTLICAGSEHRKFLRQIQVEVTITAPIFWWKEFSTYKVGTVANSTSTMHKLTSTPIIMDCFEMDDFEDVPITDKCETFEDKWNLLIQILEELRQKHNELIEKAKHLEEIKDLNEAKKVRDVAKKYWKELIRLLPESWLQKRTVTMNYENLLNMVRHRKNHKLNEWSGKDKQGVQCFIDWASCLPYAKELIFS